MALFPSNDISAEVSQLRGQGLSDSMIQQELSGKYPVEQVQQALAQEAYGGDAGDTGMPSPPSYGGRGSYSAAGSFAGAVSGEEGNVYERMEQIAESLIDEKWEDLIAEVKKILAWKEQVEESQRKMQSALEKLQEDFKTLHQGVLGQLEQYDGRMQEVGTELKAVGKVFKDVIPQFVENVKELKGITEKARK